MWKLWRMYRRDVTEWSLAVLAVSMSVAFVLWAVMTAREP